MSDTVSGNPEALAMFAEMIADREAELHPDLVPYLREMPGFGTILKHPLVVMPFVVNGLANRLYEQQRERYEEALLEEDWHTAVFLIERPWRCEYLIDLVLGRDEDGLPFPVTVLKDPEMRDLVASVWVDSENIPEHVDDWLAITSGHVPGEPLLFGNQTAFDALPLDDRGLVEVWRGDCHDGGWSWTTSRDVALFFCRRWDEGNDLLHGFVEPRYVFGYLSDRGENEVMVRREHVKHLTRTPIEEVN